MIVGIGVIVGTGVKSGVRVIVGVPGGVAVRVAGVGVPGGVGVDWEGVAVVPGVAVCGAGVPVRTTGGSGVGPPGVAVGPPPEKTGVPVAMGVLPGPMGVGVGAEEPPGVGVPFGPVKALSPHPTAINRRRRQKKPAAGDIRCMPEFCLHFLCRLKKKREKSE